jgi:hypothetical protein
MALVSRSIAGTRAGRSINLAIMVADILAVATAAVVIGLNLLRGRAVPGVGPLAIVAFPLVFIGQGWMLALAFSRMPPGSRSGRLKPRELRRLLFGELHRVVVLALLLLAFCGWLAAITASSSMQRGDPVAPSADCPYRLASHGAYTCVSKSEYDRSGAAGQRFMAGILLGFFSLHLGAALGGRLDGNRAGA